MKEKPAVSERVVCPYCRQPAKLMHSSAIYRGRSFGLVWACLPCDAYVGVHKNSATFEPLGSLANKELREWRVRAHTVFDALWRSGRTDRKGAYRILCEKMGMTKSRGHIAKFDIEECRKLVEVLKDG